MHTCTRCLGSKLDNGFARDKRKLSGLASICKACRSAEMQARRAVSPISAPEPRKTVAIVPDFSDRAGDYGDAIEFDLESLAEPIEATLAVLLRDIASKLDNDPRDNPAWTLNLLSQLRATLKEAGMSPGQKKPVVKPVVEKPRLSVVDF